MFTLSTASIVFLSLLFGMALKIADLLDEHGLKWFKGAATLFGILWGCLGSIFILSSNEVVGNFYLAMLTHWILRYRIDYLNHGIAASLMLLTLLYRMPNFTIDWLLFTVIYIGFSAHGLLNDAVDRGKTHGFWKNYFRSNSHLITIPIALTAINTDYWVVLLVSCLHLLSYEVTTKIGTAHIQRQKAIV